MRLLMLILLMFLALGLGVPRAAHADQFDLKATVTGHVDYVFVGNAMVDNTGLGNGVACLLPSNSTEVASSMLTAQPKLRSATLYVAGSLIEDGVDYPPGTRIFDPPPNLNATNASDQSALLQAARLAAAVSVQFKPPGAAAPVTVSTTPQASFLTVYYQSPGAETGNVAFFSTPIDVTEVIAEQGGGVLAGTYEVSGLVADICRGAEAICGTGTCSSVSAIHTNGNASFALLLIYEDLALPLRSVSVFEGMYALSSQVKALTLSNGQAVSNPASGTLTYYVLEGDIGIGTTNLTRPCGGDEFLRVSTANHTQCLSDAENPPGNLFNGSVNTLPATSTSPPGCTPVERCCTGPHACGLAGVDLDRYDISGALEPGATQITVDISTGSDRIGIASVVLGVDVYQPLLAADTQIRVIGNPSTTAAQLGVPVTYSLAVSNTGNVPANNVLVSINLPPGFQDLQRIALPSGSTSSVSGNVLSVSGFTVPAGKIVELRFGITTACSMLGDTLTLGAQVSATSVEPFAVRAPALLVGGPGLNACSGLDPQGPFTSLNPDRVLRGNGCAATGGTGWLACIGLALLARRRRRSVLLAGAAIAALAATAACGQRRKATATAPPSQAVAPGAALPGEACSNAMMVRVTRANTTSFCMDRFEAALGPGSLGNAAQSNDDTSVALDGSTTAAATVSLGVAPAVNVSWYQAKAACLNAGKRLCTVAEWERGCRGPQPLLYPYGDAVDDIVCNGFFQYYPTNPAATGAFKRCVSPWGAYDLSGNVEEWLDTAVPRQPGTAVLNDRATHGGGYLGNHEALACVGVEFHSPPAQTAPDRGFRCCKDLP